MSVDFSVGDVVCLKSEAMEGHGSEKGKVNAENRLTISLITDTKVVCKYLHRDNMYREVTLNKDMIVHIDDYFLVWKK